MVKINELWCKGCGYCIKFCPRNVLEMSSRRSEKGHFYPVSANAEKCTVCAICALVCPEGAIEVKEDK